MVTYPKYILRSPVVLITGPTGSGKSRAAKMLFKNREKSKGHFVTAHLASISSELLESELFGHEKGSFTGAVSKKAGYLDRAQSGTIFLDEVGELSLESQKKLLYLLEEKSYSAVGSFYEKLFSGYIIAATNRDLEQMVMKGEFREDLYYRLTASSFELPSLREMHISDKLKIFQEINTELSTKWDQCALTFDHHFVEWLKVYPFRGNVRQLRHIIEFHYLDSRESIDLEDCPLLGARQQKRSIIQDTGAPMTFREVTEKMESKYLKEVLEYYRGAVNETARKIEISKSTLIAKIRKYGINTFQIKARHLEIEPGLV
ncbi:MAG: sigma-54-dependent Fis family transcriptional regulator [Bacteriovoracaceae bacterium]|nr:sigma-54-dependent Fis family transcriptional regulator [Bacteriovoracaceae bacterium]